MNTIQTIYDYLVSDGMTAAGALGVIGNLQAESGLEPCRLQGDYQKGYAKSADYVRRIDSGELSVDAASSDGLGLGLAQWTYKPRKAALIRASQSYGQSVGSLDLQLRFLVEEMQRDYGDLWRYLCRTDNLYDAVARVCKEYERPAYNNIDQRYSFAVELQGNLGSQETAPKSEFWPPRMLCVDMNGPDVMVLQAILTAQDYNPGSVSGIFDNRTKNMVMAYQAEHGLAADGIAGPKTWRSLLEV